MTTCAQKCCLYQKRYNGCMIIIAYFFALFFLFADMNVNVAWGVAGLSVMLLINLFLQGKTYILKLSKGYLFLLAAAIVVLVNIRSAEFLKSNPLYLYAMLLALLVVACLHSDLESRRRVLKILLCGAFIVAAIPIVSKMLPSFYIQYILSNLSETSQQYVHSLMVQGYSGVVGAYIALTANYIVIGFAISVARYFNNRKKINLLLAMYFMISLIFVNRRSELLACVAAFIVLLYLCISKKGRILLLTILISFTCAGVIGILSLKYSGWQYDGDNRLLKTIMDLILGNDISNGRNALYHVAWQLFCENPFFGIGFGNFRKEGSLIIPNITNVHNIYLQLLCELGIVGAGIIIFALGYLLFRTYTVFVHSHKQHDFLPKYFALFMTIYILVLGLFDNPIFQDTFWLLLSIIIFCSFRVESINKEIKLK